MTEKINLLGHSELMRSAANRIAELEALVRWLAVTYGDNTPIFATQSWDGQPLSEGILMRRIYYEVVGEKNPPNPGRWAQCPECQIWRVIAAPVEPAGP